MTYVSTSPTGMLGMVDGAKEPRDPHDGSPVLLSSFLSGFDAELW